MRRGLIYVTIIHIVVTLVLARVLAGLFATAVAHHKHVHASQSHLVVTKIIRREELESMPTVTGLTESSESSETTSYSYSIAIPNSEATEGVTEDPYISRHNQPEGLVFIIVGVILGVILVSFVLYKLVTDIAYNRKAKLDKEEYDHLPGMTFGKLGGSSSTSSILEKSSNSSSMYFLSKHNSLMQLQDDLENANQNNIGYQVHSYRDAVSNNIPSTMKRGSMYISPVLELMGSRQNLSSFDHSLQKGPLDPLASLISLSLPYGNYSESMDNYLQIEKLNLLLQETKLQDPSLTPLGANSDVSDNHKIPKRPPSLVLDELIDNDSD